MIYGICTVGGYDADSVNMPEVTAWAQDTGKVTYYSTWSAAKILWLRNNEPHGTGYIEL